MKYISFVLAFTITTTAFSQPLRLHLAGGFSNYSGDIQQKRFTLNQANGVVAAGATFNVLPKLAIRSDFSFARVGADDKNNSGSSFRKRNLNFKSIIHELNLMLEYDILSLENRKLTPYVFAGVGVFRFSPYTTDSAGSKIYLHGLYTEGQETSAHPDRRHYKKTQLNLPVGGGVKYALSDDIHLSLELGYRKLFTDYLDDVSTTYADQAVLLAERGPAAVQYAFRGDELKSDPQVYPAAGTQRGSPKFKDSYYFGQFRISFRMNWFDNGYNGSGRKSRLGCPTKVY